MYGYSKRPESQDRTTRNNARGSYSVLSETPEEDAWKKMEAWAKPKGLLEKGASVFGRNTYPTDTPAMNFS